MREIDDEAFKVLNLDLGNTGTPTLPSNCWEIGVGRVMWTRILDNLESNPQVYHGSLLGNFGPITESQPGLHPKVAVVRSGGKDVLSHFKLQPEPPHRVDMRIKSRRGQLCRLL